MKIEKEFSPMKLVIETKEEKEFIMAVLLSFSKHNTGPFVSMQSNSYANRAQSLYKELEYK